MTDTSPKPLGSCPHCNAPRTDLRLVFETLGTRDMSSVAADLSLNQTFNVDVPGDVRPSVLCVKCSAQSPLPNRTWVYVVHADKRLCLFKP